MDGAVRFAPPELDAQRASWVQLFRWLPDYPDFGGSRKLRIGYGIGWGWHRSLQRFFPALHTPQQIAAGAEGDGTNSYTVTTNFTLAESWRYVANSSCTITLTYSVNAQ